MSLFNLYAKTVRGARLGTPAQSTDITEGFFRFSLLADGHSTKDETVYADVVGCIAVDDSTWEIYEAESGDPVFCHKQTGRTYNAVTDFVVTKRSGAFSVELCRLGKIEGGGQPEGLSIDEGRNPRATNIADFA
jgi:hypothetical protein